MTTHSLAALAAAAVLLPAFASAQQFTFSVIADGLQRPVGIAVEGSDTLYFTEIPEPGVGGGSNGVSRLDLTTGTIDRLSLGEPEPVNLAVARNGDVYWTCKSAGVILRHVEATAMTSLFATGLDKPNGISVGRDGGVYITEIPTPGTGGEGSANLVSVLRGNGKVVLSMGEPEPTDVVVARNGDLYWTCKSAGVILKRSGGVTSLLRSGLNHPTGIALDRKGEVLYFTEVPTPGVSGADGGTNAIRALFLATGTLRTIHTGDPEPTDIAVATNGNLYWTCTSAGVIVEAKRRGRR